MLQSVSFKFAIVSSVALWRFEALAAGQCPDGGADCTESFRYWRLKVRSANGAHIWCFQEIKFINEEGTLPLAGNTSASSTYFDIGCGTDSQNDVGGCHYCSSPISQEYPQWWEYDFGEPMQVGAYELQALTDFDAVFMPRTWTLEASNDRAAWTVLHEEPNYHAQAWGARGSTHNFPFAMPEQMGLCAYSTQLDGLTPKASESQWNLGTGWLSGGPCVELTCNIDQGVSWCTRQNSGYTSHVDKRSDWGYCRSCEPAAKKEPYTFIEHVGHQCAGTDGDVLRDYVGSVSECKRKCYDLGAACVGFVRFDSGREAGKCFFRRGKLKEPYPHNNPPRNCYERLSEAKEEAKKKVKKEPYSYIEHAGQQCAGTDGDVLRDYVGTVDECKRKCYNLGVTCAGFVRFNGGSIAGKCFFRRGRLKEPYPHSDPPRDCYERLFQAS